MGRFGIAAKIYLIVALMAVVAGSVGVLGTFMGKAEDMRDAASRALLGEKVNTLVMAVVMDSRGVYMGRSAEEVEKFGKPLLGNLDKLDGLLRQWEPLILPEQRADFTRLNDAARQFITFRRETVQVGRDQGAEVARTFSLSVLLGGIVAGIVLSAVDQLSSRTDDLRRIVTQFLGRVKAA